MLINLNITYTFLCPVSSNVQDNLVYYSEIKDYHGTKTLKDLFHLKTRTVKTLYLSY